MTLYDSLQKAVYDLQQRGLVLATRWAAEALVGMDQPDDPKPNAHALPMQTLVAKTYFDCHEYDRCWYSLRESEDPVGKFLRNYSRYISGERQREDKPFENKEDRANPYLEEILRDMGDDEDPFILYLRGVALRRTFQEKSATELLIKSLQKYPLNWSCWQEFLSCFKTLTDTLGAINTVKSEIPEFYTMRTVFEVFCHQEFYQADGVTKDLFEQLKGTFPSFTFLDAQKALIQIHNVNYDAAEQIFESILKKDPYRLEELDLYSNLLYVTEQRAKLSLVAQEAIRTDKYRAEACCIVANYYSLRGEHEQAAEYYKRALISNPNYLSAWTLLGHEFVELKNTHAAIESYRSAVRISNRDFRAWYGLGQAYEVLDMASYAHYYYSRALSLSPGDTRIWGAMANCYEKMQDYEQSIRTYQMALRICKSDPYFYFKLGHLFDEKHEREKAQEYYELCAADDDDDQGDFKPQARLWLARTAISRQKWDEALEYANAIVNAEYSSGLEEEARIIIREALYHNKGSRFNSS